MTSSKRLDLQGIRGFAILAVLLFHFFPRLFPNGYIGVDQFFVLSGYLIAMVLSREKSMSLSVMGDFYYRRIKRIAPLYLLVILMILMSMFLLQSSSRVVNNMESAWSSLFFVTNMRGPDPANDYFAMLNVAEDEFAHTWSLAVEMQFYFFVPFLFLGVHLLDQRYIHSYLCLAGLTSLTYHLSSDTSTSFNSVFCRLWQFIFGIYCFLVVNSPSACVEKELIIEEKGLLDGEPAESLRVSSQVRTVMNLFIALCCTTTLIMAMSHVKSWDDQLRVIVTLLTGLMMVCGSFVQYPLVCNKPLTYLGDISYAVYLIHWPIAAYCKINYTGELFAVFLGFLFSLLIGALLTETYEKFYRKLSKSPIIGLIAVLYGLCIVLLINCSLNQDPRDFDLEVDPNNVTLEEAIQINYENDEHESSDMVLSYCRMPAREKNGRCDFANVKKSSGGKKIMVIGNSYALNNAKPIYNYCREQASEMSMFVALGCQTFESAQWNLEHCNASKTSDESDMYLSVVKKKKPDVLFMMFRYNTLFDRLPKDETTDVLLIHSQQKMKEFEWVVKERIYVLDAVPRTNRVIVKRLNEGLEMGIKTPPRELLQPGADYKLARRRLAAIVKGCSKCELIDYLPSFTVNGTFTPYNPESGLSYMSSGMHLTPVGIHRIAPLYKDICNNL